MLFDSEYHFKKEKKKHFVLNGTMNTDITCEMASV
jgi:hypothetical protein